MKGELTGTSKSAQPCYADEACYLHDEPESFQSGHGNISGFVILLELLPSLCIALRKKLNPFLCHFCASREVEVFGNLVHDGLVDGLLRLIYSLLSEKLFLNCRDIGLEELAPCISFRVRFRRSKALLVDTFVEVKGIHEISTTYRDNIETWCRPKLNVLLGRSE